VLHIRICVTHTYEWYHYLSLCNTYEYMLHMWIYVTRIVDIWHTYEYMLHICMLHIW